MLRPSLPEVHDGIQGLASSPPSTEILLHAGLSPFKRARDMKDDEAERLFDACRKTLADWTETLRTRAGDRFPEKVTAFHDEMAAHGKYRQPCPVCGAPIQRIVHAENESNYCARCQTGGRVLADRSLSKLLKETWRGASKNWKEPMRGALGSRPMVDVRRGQKSLHYATWDPMNSSPTSVATKSTDHEAVGLQDDGATSCRVAKRRDIVVLNSWSFDETPPSGSILT